MGNIGEDVEPLIIERPVDEPVPVEVPEEVPA